MSHICCPRCRIRFSPEAASYVVACPDCGAAPQPLARPADALGFRLVGAGDLSFEMPEAISVALPDPDTDPRRSS